MINIKDEVVVLFRTRGYCDGLRIGGDANETINDITYETPSYYGRTRGRSNKLGFIYFKSIT